MFLYCFLISLHNYHFMASSANSPLAFISPLFLLITELLNFSYDLRSQQDIFLSLFWCKCIYILIPASDICKEITGATFGLSP